MLYRRDYSLSFFKGSQKIKNLFICTHKHTLNWRFGLTPLETDVVESGEDAQKTSFINYLKHGTQPRDLYAVIHKEV